MKVYTWIFLLECVWLPLPYAYLKLDVGKDHQLNCLR